MSDPASGACDYCGLPLAPARRIRPRSASLWLLPRSRSIAASAAGLPLQVASERGTAGQINTMLARLGLGIFLTLNVMVFTMACGPATSTI